MNLGLSIHVVHVLEEHHPHPDKYTKFVSQSSDIRHVSTLCFRHYFAGSAWFSAVVYYMFGSRVGVFAVIEYIASCVYIF